MKSSVFVFYLLSCLSGFGLEAFRVDPARPLDGAWTVDAGKNFYCQQLMFGRFFNSQIKKKSKIISEHTSGVYKVEQNTLQWQNRFASSGWIDYVGKSDPMKEFAFVNDNQHIRSLHWEMDANKKPTTYNRMENLSTVGPLDGVWQRKISLTVLSFKCYSRGRFFRTETDIRTKKVTGSVIGTFSIQSGKMLETWEYATESWKEYIGNGKTYTIDVRPGALWLASGKGVAEEWTPMEDLQKPKTENEN